MRRIVAIIPARMASTRFPGKPLAPILGLPMIEHVRRRVALCNLLDDVIVATCDEEIKKVVETAGGRVMMTAGTHIRCTDRVAEAAVRLDADVVINVQGDEPLIHPNAIAQLCKAILAAPERPCINLANVITSESDFLNANQIKVVCDQDDNALYMSRQPIPTTRHWGETRVLRQLGMIAFRKDFLETLARLPPTPLEETESVDMLRAIEHGYPVKMVITPYESFGVDTLADLRLAEAQMGVDDVAAALLERQRS